MRLKCCYAFFVWLTICSLAACRSERAIDQAPGILAKAEPLQTPATAVPPLEKKGYIVAALARYEITSRILSKEFYRWDAGADLVPVDLAVGWGPMSDSAILDKFKIKQDTRRVTWHSDNHPLSFDEIRRNSANMHLIAADKDIARQIRNVRPGSVVTMRGYLVEVRGKNGFTWRSSLSRDDRGDGACELMWVESFSVE